jgi:hypothetical protein
MQCTNSSNIYVSAAKKFSMFFAHKFGNRGKIAPEASQTPSFLQLSEGHCVTLSSTGRICHRSKMRKIALKMSAHGVHPKDSLLNQIRHYRGGK